MRLTRLFTLFGACAGLQACATQHGIADSLQPLAFSGSTARMPEGRPVDAPHGYSEMCGRDTRLCAIPRQAADVLPDGARKSLLDAVNRRVNGDTRQVSDLVAFRRTEYWRPAGEGFHALGDCEDMAIEKRLELRRAGFPDDAMFYAVGYRRDLGLHTVLVARLAGGDVVLDSRSPYLRPWSQAPYTWILRQSDESPAIWRAVERPAALTIAAAAPSAGAPGA